MFNDIRGAHYHTVNVKHQIEYVICKHILQVSHSIKHDHQNNVSDTFDIWSVQSNAKILLLTCSFVEGCLAFICTYYIETNCVKERAHVCDNWLIKNKIYKYVKEQI